MSKKRKNKYITTLGLLGTVVVFIACLYIPRLLFDSYTKEENNHIKEFPYTEYKANETILSKKLSEELDALDRIKLISGTWPSTYEECDKSKGFISELDAVKLAKEGIEKYYAANCYYQSLESSYGNWYSWETKLYKYTDTSFNTYTAYLWKITFIKYDNSETHTILMTDNGTIINAECKQKQNKLSPIISAYLDTESKTQHLKDTLNAKELIYAYEYSYFTKPLKPYYPDVNLEDAEITAYSINVKKGYNSLESYIVYQYYKKGNYGIGITSLN